MDELKPCPFCGSKAELWELDGEIDIRVIHKHDCWIDAFEGLFIDIEDGVQAIEAWNTRHEPEFATYEDVITYMDGQRYATIKRCGNCDCQILIGSNYCHVCGKKVKVD